MVFEDFLIKHLSIVVFRGKRVQIFLIFLMNFLCLAGHVYLINLGIGHGPKFFITPSSHFVL